MRVKIERAVHENRCPFSVHLNFMNGKLRIDNFPALDFCEYIRIDTSEINFPEPLITYVYKDFQGIERNVDRIKSIKGIRCYEQKEASFSHLLELVFLTNTRVTITNYDC